MHEPVIVGDGGVDTDLGDGDGRAGGLAVPVVLIPTEVAGWSIRLHSHEVLMEEDGKGKIDKEHNLRATVTGLRGSHNWGFLRKCGDWQDQSREEQKCREQNIHGRQLNRSS